MTDRDVHGQPPRRFYQARAEDRAVHEMLGLIKGIVCDGVISDDEVGAFHRWLSANPDAMVSWPGNVLAKRILDVLADGVVDLHEKHDLYELFCNTIGDGGTDTGLSTNYSTRLPFDDPCPTIIFDRQTFVLTGQFVYGTRARCEREITDRGGTIHPSVVQRPHTLVIGTIASHAWLHTDFGRKIEKAVDLREQGHGVKIVSEESWTEALAMTSL